MEDKRSKELYRAGRYMSLLLRHEPTKENLAVDKEGYVYVNQLIKALKITRSELEHIVESNNKSRFAFSKNGIKIRAVQGHSFDVDLNLKELESSDIPLFLFHGTSPDATSKIKEEGLKPMSRQHVHLTDDYEIAMETGKRKTQNKSKVDIIIIAGQLLFDSGIPIYISDNGHYLVEHVPSEFISVEPHYNRGVDGIYRNLEMADFLLKRENNGLTPFQFSTLYEVLTKFL